MVGYGCKEWENMGCFGNLIVVLSFSICNIFYGIRKDYISLVDVGIVSQTTLKPCILSM